MTFIFRYVLFSMVSFFVTAILCVFGFYDGDPVNFIPWILGIGLFAVPYIGLVVNDIETAMMNRIHKKENRLYKVDPLSFQKYYYKEAFTIADILVMLFYLPLWIAAFVVYMLYLLAYFYWKQLVKLLHTVVYVKVKKGVSE